MDPSGRPCPAKRTLYLPLINFQDQAELLPADPGVLPKGLEENLDEIPTVPEFIQPSAPPEVQVLRKDPPALYDNVFQGPPPTTTTMGPPLRPMPPPLPLRRHKRFSCDLTVPPIRSLSRSTTITEKPGTWNINLIDAPQGSTKSLAALCASTSTLAVKYPHHEHVFNPGVVQAHLARGLLPSTALEQSQLNFTVARDWDNCPVPFPTPLNKTLSDLINAVGDVFEIPVPERVNYRLKLCDTEEFLQPNEALGDHEIVQRYLKFHQDVPLRLLHNNGMDRRLARDETDDKAPCHLYKYLGSACAFSVSRLSLQTLLNAYHRELTKLRSQCPMNVLWVLEVVRTINSLLCGVTSQQLEEAIGMLNRLNSASMTQKEVEESENVLVLLQQALVQLLQVVFDSFQSDFRGPPLGRDSLPRRIEDNREILQFTMAALYNLQPGWLVSFDYFSISCVLTHGGKKICEAGVSENISTALSLGNKIQCNRQMVFPVLVTKLPYESMLTFCLIGCKQGRAQEQLRWAMVPLFSWSALVNGTVLLGMSTLAGPPSPATPSLADAHHQPMGVILQLDFPNEFEWRYQRPVSDPSTVLYSEPFKELDKKISEVSKKHCLRFLSENERAMLWSKRYCATPESTFLHLLLGGAPSWAPEDLPDIYSIVAHWAISTPEEALFLLSDSFHDTTVRATAVHFFEQLSHGELEIYLPQLVQALKYEWELNGALVMLLLDISVRNLRIAQQLYWLLMDAQLDVYYQGWYVKVLAALKHCCGRALRRELENQTQLVGLLTQVAENVRLADTYTRRKEVLEREKGKIHDFFSDGKTCRLPLDAAFHVKAVDVDSCKFYNSNAAPLGITFICSDPLAKKITVICKTGDSLRQDSLIMQIVRVLDRVWLQDGLDMRMVTYRCLSTGNDQGLVEVVQDAVTLAKIQQEWGLAGTLRQDTLEKWFHMRNKTTDSYEKAVLNFLYSCAGWCVATFILGICDRHNDNIMLKNSGHMFHIDFGKIMGNAQTFATIKRDRVPFIFSPEMQHFITGGSQNPQRLQLFMELCCRAYNVIRRRSALVLSLLELMLGAGLPEMKDVSDLVYIQNNLRPHDSDLEATSYFTRMIKKSMGCMVVMLNYLSHSMAQGKKAGPAPLPPSPGPATSANIQAVHIHKYSSTGRTLFEVTVTIDDGFLNIKKTFGEFELIHKQLQKHFIESALPQFPSCFRMSFHPSRKMALLNKYFTELFNGPCKGNEFVCSLFLDGPVEEIPINEGSPQIQLHISYVENKLSVMVKHLKNIRTASGSSPDTYVALQLQQEHHKPLKRKTNVVRSNHNPTFNELLEYPDVMLLPNAVLDVKVKNKKKKTIAVTSMLLDDVYMDKEEWLQLDNCGS